MVLLYVSFKSVCYEINIIGNIFLHRSFLNSVKDDAGAVYREAGNLLFLGPLCGAPAIDGTKRLFYGMATQGCLSGEARTFKIQRSHETSRNGGIWEVAARSINTFSASDTVSTCVVALERL